MKDKLKRSWSQRFIARHILKYYVAWLHNFNRGKLKKNLLERKEKEEPLCTDCGLCCINCVAHDSNTNLCKIWKYTNITRCREFPITPWQLKLDNLEDKCRYYWESK